MTIDDSQQPAPRHGKVLEALARAERKVFTRPAPKSAKAQVKFLLTRAKGSTKALAERLGVSRRTVERYRAGTLTTPQKRLRAALVEETESGTPPLRYLKDPKREVDDAFREWTAAGGVSYITITRSLMDLEDAGHARSRPLHP
ncbi:putative terminal protein (plasmid) [Streptomyces hygroscopicus subsp. jinggangensis 5008]|nr:putative terminal protein [Streptomyces hygroscopicus subsp. jinggangensis 5008]AGF68317.1 putative terminal protein [Streptomyces hygroscopicus subsp. jinggangensis TL01]